MGLAEEFNLKDELTTTREALSSARWIAWRLRRIVEDLPADLEDLDPELAEYIYADSNADQWIDGPEGFTRFGGEGPAR